MEVILREDVENLGRAGDIVKVKAGFGRNYLLPGGLAYPATESNRRRVAAEAAAQSKRVAVQKDAAELVAARLEGVDLTFQMQAGEGDRLFGSVTTSDIAEKLAESGISVDKRAIEMPEPIKSIGVYKLPIRLHPEVRPEIRVWVVKT